MWIGVDDTDGPEGGCTTYVLTEILRVAREHGVDLVGAPHLVRLNPNVPWKTRGNAALSARFGVGTGRPRAVGELDGRPVRAYPRGRRLPEERSERFLAAAWQAVLAASAHGPRADPAMVAFPSRPMEAFYRHAVSGLVPVGAARAAIARAGARLWLRGSARGLVGAVAAVAWRGGRSTWELISYRRDGAQGLRRVDAASVRRAAGRYPSLFQCWDPATRRLLVAPHTRCPVLFGLRASAPTDLVRARRMVRSEAIARWALFRTNQGTGDHLVDRSLAELGPYESGRLRGWVRGAPEVLPGGHVRFRIADAEARTLTCLAFEPTKLLPRVAAQLADGDEVVAWGGRGRDPVLRLEGIEILRTHPGIRGVRPPRCPDCLRTSSSLGRGRGYRCPGCHRRFAPEAARLRRIPREFGRGAYEPTPSARRHLHPIRPIPPAPASGPTGPIRK